MPLLSPDLICSDYRTRAALERAQPPVLQGINNREAINAMIG